jgi:hypothetical protein
MQKRMADRLVLSEEPEISKLLKGDLSKRMGVYTNALAGEVKNSEQGVAQGIHIHPVLSEPLQ